MERGRLRYALVELRVEVPEGVYWNAAAAVKAAVNADPGRQGTVESVLDHEAIQSADVIIFPGYTLVGRTVPSVITQKVKGRYVVLELLAPDKSDATTAKGGWRRTFVLGPGGRLCGPVRQWVITSDDAWNDDSSPSRESLRVIEELAGERAPSRKWKSRGRVETGLMLCGEVNTVYAQADGTGWPVDPRLLDALAGCYVIANPAHTPSTLPAMQRKREWLSARRALLTTANLHGGFMKWKTPKEPKGAPPKPVRARQHTSTAEAYVDGKRYNVDAIRAWAGATVVDDPRYRVALFDL
ncbi:MAG: hypothetical protein JWM10_4150 [Myxococcaceae bacterium]|nr:hypothetical protein [Myxococcaceae bacterium]